MTDNAKPLRPSPETFSMPIPCPECGKQTSQSLAWLVAHNEIACPNCGFMIDLQGEKIRALIEKGEQMFQLMWGRKSGE